MKSKTVTLCIVVISNLLILTVAFEILSRVFLSSYMDSKLNKITRRYQFDDDLDNHSIFASNNQVKLPHPYLGYVRPGEEDQFDIVNEKTKKSNGFIAIFGGSVAENFYRFNKEKNLLQESLKKTLGLENNLIKNYALGGYKQPQHLIASILFRPNAKVTINIEGYNEITKIAADMFPHYYPMSPISKLYYSGVETWDIYFKSGKTRASQRKLRTSMEKDWWFRFIPTFFKILYFLNEKFLIGLEQKLAHQQYKKRRSFESLTFLERIIYWLERSCEQQNFLAERGVKAYFFFQPSPYIPKSKKKLTNHEKKMIKDFEIKVREIWRKKFYIQNITEAFLLVRKLIKGNLSLNLVDMSQVFLDEPREVFVDGRCHLNQLGHSLLTERVVKVIKETYSESEKPKLCRDDFCSLVEKFK